MGAAHTRFRSQLANHANSLEAELGRNWLTANRLLFLHDEPTLGSALRDHLKRLLRPVKTSNIALIYSFQQIVTALAPIPVAPLKGIRLLDNLYRDDIGVRPMGDIDLLVPEESIEEAISKLQPLGYNEPESSHRLRHVMHHRRLVGKRSALELHTRLGTAFMPNSSWDAVATSPGVVHDCAAHTLSAGAELAYLLVHSYKHQLFCCLGWADEILALAERVDSETARDMVEMATRVRCRTTLAICIALFRRAVGEDFLPMVDLAALNTSRARTWLYERIFLSKPDVMRPLPRRHRLLEEFHASLIVDRPMDGLVELRRKAIVHFLARFPTRI